MAMGAPYDRAGVRLVGVRLRRRSSISAAVDEGYARGMSQQSPKWITVVRDLWCKLFHDEPMWPVRGQYQCRRCLCYHPVRWEQIDSKEDLRESDHLKSARPAFHHPF